jgi:hypothetical protein
MSEPEDSMIEGKARPSENEAYARGKHVRLCAEGWAGQHRVVLDPIRAIKASPEF